MEKKVRCVEVRMPDGKPILNLHLIYQSDASGVQGAPIKGQNGQVSTQSPGDSSMTDAQKRYLFRILAEQGIEEDKAHQRLKELLGVDSLKQASKTEASNMIEHLLEQSQTR